MAEATGEVGVAHVNYRAMAQSGFAMNEAKQYAENIVEFPVVLRTIDGCTTLEKIMEAFEFEVDGNKCLLDIDDAQRLFGRLVCSLPGGYLRIQIGNDAHLLHRYVLGVGREEARDVDHINGDPKDNRKSNLRLATKSQNAMNQRARPDCKSGVTGVWWSPERERWCAGIAAGGRRIALGRFVTMEEAIAARRAGEDKYHGEFAARHGVERLRAEIGTP